VIPLLDQVRQIAEEAGQEILTVYRGTDFGTRLKADRSPVTDADLAADRAIREGLARVSKLPVLSEEVDVPFEERRRWKEFWLVDPLDGTKDFLARNDEFTVNIALIRDGRPVLGVIGVPALGELFAAVEGGGCFHHVGAEAPRRLGGRPAGPVRAMARSRFHDTPETARFASRFGIPSLVPIGSAIKFGRLAQDVVQIYPRFAAISEWDIAAGDLIVHEAGGRMIDWETGRPPQYNGETLRAAPFLAVGPGIDPALFSS
jgi:3'(2'), 5'-bisphosphate nucleotidase